MTAPENPKQALTEELLPLVYDELRKAARRYFRRQPPGFTLRPTELVNEACLHLLKHAGGRWTSPEHFRAIATVKIWQVVVDHIRKREAAKRGGRAYPGPAASREPEERRRRVALDAIEVPWHDRTVDLLDLADALHALGAESGRLREVVMLHWFGDFNYTDVGRLLGVSASTTERDFRYALAWLNRKLSGDDSRGH